MFSKSAQYYDEIYGAMARIIQQKRTKAHKLIQKYKRKDGNTLLDVACGTGIHAGLSEQVL